MLSLCTAAAYGNVYKAFVTESTSCTCA